MRGPDRAHSAELGAGLFRFGQSVPLAQGCPHATAARHLHPIPAEPPRRGTVDPLLEAARWRLPRRPELPLVHGSPGAAATVWAQSERLSSIGSRHHAWVDRQLEYWLEYWRKHLQEFRRNFPSQVLEDIRQRGGPRPLKPDQQAWTEYTQLILEDGSFTLKQQWLLLELLVPWKGGATQGS